MRKLFLSFVLILFAINSYSQSTESKNEINKADSTIISSIEDLNFKLCELERYKLYPTDNMYQFILLDKFSGRHWHVQWGLSPSKRWIRRIF